MAGALREIEDSLPPALEDWFARRGWAVRAHQREMLLADRDGAHALLMAPTGAGKTLAGFLPSLAELAVSPREGLHTLYVSPLKALASDVARNLMAPIEEAGLRISVETRTGDTGSAARARQRQQPPHILLTTPESLSLLLSYPQADTMFTGLQRLVVDEVHALAPSKRGDQLALAMARVQALAPALRRVGLSATMADPDVFRRWLAPGDVRLVRCAEGAAPDIEILMPDERIPWSGHNGRWAARAVMQRIEQARLAIVFVNTRALAELIFQELWAANDKALPIGIHHGSLSVEARRKVEAAMAAGRLRAIVATSSLDLGIDWGDVDLVIQMGAPKGAARLVQRTGRANHRLDTPSRALIVPGNRFEYLEALAARDAVLAGELDQEPLRPGGLDVLAQHVFARACAGPFHPDALYREVRAAAPYADLSREAFEAAVDVVATGGYALRAYERYRRLRPLPDGRLQLSNQAFAAQHRLNAGTIVEAVAMKVRLGRRVLGQVEEWFASQLRTGDSFLFAGQVLEVTGYDGGDLCVRMGRGTPSIPSYMGGRMPLSTHLAARVRRLLNTPSRWPEMPGEVAEWLEMQASRSVLPGLGDLLVETFPRDGRWYMVAYGFAGRPAHQTLGMLLTRRMETAGLKPLGFVASDYMVACWSLDEPRGLPALFSPHILEDELAAWMEASPFLRRAFRDTAIIGGLIERAIPGQHKTGRALTVSSDLIYDVLRRHQPDHLLLRAAWADARHKLTDLDRLAAMLETAQHRLTHRRLDRVSPLAVPALMEVSREPVKGESAETALLFEAEALVRDAMGKGA
jgi:ATP-dependent Lhr-like helicase